MDGTRLDLRLEAAGLAFPAGAGGVPTMRIVCELRASLPAPLAAGTGVTFADTSYAERIGWREIVVIGDGTTVAGPDGGAAPASEDVSARLTSYPAALLTQPLDVRSTAFTVSPGGAAAAPFAAPDAAPLAGTPSPSPGASAAAGGPVAASPPATPGTAGRAPRSRAASAARFPTSSASPISPRSSPSARSPWRWPSEPATP